MFELNFLGDTFLGCTLSRTLQHVRYASMAICSLALLNPVSNFTIAQEGRQTSLNSDAAIQNHLSQMLDSIAPYHPQNGVAGKATLSGSSTMQQLGLQWSTRFKQFHPGVEFTRGADGSAAAIESLKNDPTVIAGISYSITASEIESLKKAKCQDPAVVIVALDPVAILVHESNPLRKVTPEQLKQLFAATNSAKTWGDVGVTGSLQNQPIRIYGKGDKVTSTAFIENTILGPGNRAAVVSKTFESQAELLEGMKQDQASIAVGSMGETDGTHVLALEINGSVIEPNEANFIAGKYPLVRPLALVFDKALINVDGGVRREILNYVLSRDGQAEVMRAGFFPVNPNFIAQQMASFSGPQLR